MTAPGWPDPQRIARLMVNAYTRDDRRQPTSRDVEIARVLCADLAAEVAALAAAARREGMLAAAGIADQASRNWHDHQQANGAAVLATKIRAAAEEVTP
jgi:hypothetical protein